MQGGRLCRLLHQCYQHAALQAGHHHLSDLRCYVLLLFCLLVDHRRVSPLLQTMHQPEPFTVAFELQCIKRWLWCRFCGSVCLPDQTQVHLSADAACGQEDASIAMLDAGLWDCMAAQAC